MTVGESRTFTLSYPADYVVAELAGTSVGYTVHLKELRRRVVPALDDEFAKDLGEELDSLDALRARVRADLEAEAKDASERQLRADLLKQLGQAPALPGARRPGRSGNRPARRRLRAAAHVAADRPAPRQHRLGRLPPGPARAGAGIGGLGAGARPGGAHATASP